MKEFLEALDTYTKAKALHQQAVDCHTDRYAKECEVNLQKAEQNLTRAFDAAVIRAIDEGFMKR